MVKEYKTINTKWLIPLLAIFVSLLFHFILLQINFENDEINVTNNIAVKIKLKKHQSMKRNDTNKLKLSEKRKIDKKNKKHEITANKLLQDANALIQSLSDQKYNFNLKGKWRNSVTIDVNLHKEDILNNYTEANGTEHIKIANNCFSLRESNFLFLFDEPIYVSERCRKNNS